MYRYLIVLLFVFIILLLSCNTTEPPPPEKIITLTLEDAASVEVWIKLTTTDLQLPAALTLKQSDAGGNTVTQDIILSYADTLLYIDSLLPNTTYTFHAAIQPSNHTSEVKSNELSLTTMDTTSHNFTWQTFEFGQHSSSVLRDVAIITPNNIWAVGEIYMNDSLGQPDSEFYNLVKWDGSNWNIQRIKFTNSQGQTFLAPIKSVFAFNENDIWLGMDQMIHWNGNEFIEVEISSSVFNSWINKIWGTSSEDLYVVGNNGNIAHYSGPTGGWQKIESGTETRINDAWGIISNENKTILYCPVSSFFVPGDKKILKITDRKVDSVAWNRDARLYSAWAINENFLYVCGEGGFENKTGKWEEINIPLVSMTSIRGNDINDIFIVGDNGFKAHFNGVGWKTYNIMNNNGYMAIFVKDNTVAVSGRQLGYGLIEIGTRN